MIWADCLFSFNISFLLRKVEDVTTISKSQSLTSVSIKHCTLIVPNETTTLFLLRVIIKAIFIHASKEEFGRKALSGGNVWDSLSCLLTLLESSDKNNPEMEIDSVARQMH